MKAAAPEHRKRPKAHRTINPAPKNAERRPSGVRSLAALLIYSWALKFPHECAKIQCQNASSRSPTDPDSTGPVAGGANASSLVALHSERSLRVKLRRLSLGYKSLLDPHSRTLRNLYRWAFSFHLWLCAHEAAGPVRNPEQPEFSPPRYGQSGVGRLLRQRSVRRFQRYRDPRADTKPNTPGPPCGIDPATASHEGADANVPTGLEPGGAK